jgi:hypothetical protein
MKDKAFIGASLVAAVAASSAASCQLFLFSRVWESLGPPPSLPRRDRSFWLSRSPCSELDSILLIASRLRSVSRDLLVNGLQ